MKRSICKDREDIFEENSRRREVWELAEGPTKSYLKTGEFGGAGGMGGGLSGVLGGGGIRFITRRMFRGRMGHDEERKREKRREVEGGEEERERGSEKTGRLSYDIWGLSSKERKK